jgi:hypothetical protein
VQISLSISKGANQRTSVFSGNELSWFTNPKSRLFRDVTDLLITQNTHPMVAKAELVLKEKFAEVFYDADNKLITAQWIGFLKLDDVKFGCQEINRFVRKYQMTKHLSDHTKLKVLSKEVQEYLTGQWFMEVEKLGLKKIAVLVSEDVFAQATVNNVNTKGALGNLSIYTFNSLIRCEQWLTE